MSGDSVHCVHAVDPVLTSAPLGAASLCVGVYM